MVAGATLAGCAGSRKTASVSQPGDPLPGDEELEGLEAPTSDRAQRLLDEWKGRGATTPAPSGVIARSSWTRQQPIQRLANPMGRITRITVHHDGMNAFTSTSQADAARRLEQIRSAHVGQGWADIGYHFAVDPAGRIWEARPMALQGAHVKDNNENNLGILVLGNFMETRPTSAATATLDGFLAQQMSRFGVGLSRVYTHQELKPTACPGTHLQRYMLDTRSRTGRLARA